MRNIYIDATKHCHPTNDGMMTAIETDFFDGMCDAFVEGYCVELHENGRIHKIYPCKPYSELAAAQAQYELDMAEAARAYQEGVDSI